MASAYPAGIGTEQQAMQATAAMRQEPWYAAMLKAWGLQNPPPGVNGGNPVDAQGNPAKLNDDQRQAIMEAAQHYGIGMNNKFDQIDENGQISEAHHKLKKLAIGAAIGGLALTGLGAAGIGPMAGVFGSAATGGVGIGETAATAGIPSATALGLPVTAGLGTAGTAGAVAGGVGTASKIAALLGKGGTMGKISDIIGAAGKGIGEASSAAGENRRQQEEMGLTANAQNISGNAQYEQAITNRRKLENTERMQALKNVFMQSALENPRVSPFNPVGAPKVSDQYRSTLSQLASQASDRLATPQSTMPALRPYDPLDITNVQKSTGTEKGTLEKIGDWVSPTTSTLSKIIPMLRQRAA